MSVAPLRCEVSIHAASGGMRSVQVEARTLWEAAGLALAQFRAEGVTSTGIMQVTVARPVTYVVQPDRFWRWLQREDPPAAGQERDIWNKLRDLLEIPLSRSEKRERQQR